MYKGQSFLAIIPARGGSKGLPEKNIKSIGKKPLIAWSILHALNSKYIDEIFISTDNEKIADIGRSMGMKIPHLRPAEISQDTSPSWQFVIHTIEFYKRLKKSFDYIILLEPTSPLRKKHDTDRAIELLINSETKSGLVSLGKVHTEHPLIVKKIIGNRVLPYINNADKINQRQQADEAYFPYGVVYIVRTEDFEKNHLFYSEESIPYFIERWQSYEIDDIWDFMCVEKILENKLGEIL